MITLNNPSNGTKKFIKDKLVAILKRKPTGKEYRSLSSNVYYINLDDTHLLLMYKTTDNDNVLDNYDIEYDETDTTYYLKFTNDGGSTYVNVPTLYTSPTSLDDIHCQVVDCSSNYVDLDSVQSIPGEKTFGLQKLNTAINDTGTNKFIVMDGNGKLSPATMTLNDFNVAVGEPPDMSSYLAKDDIYKSLERVQIHPSATATATNGIAIGSSARSGEYDTIALGAHTDTTHNGCIAIGRTSIARGSYSIAIGRFAETIGTHGGNGKAIAIGNGAVVRGEYCIGIGSAHGSETFDINQSNCIGIGRGIQISGYVSIAIGLLASTTEGYSIALGYNTKGNGGFGIAIGSSAQALTYKSLAIGESAKCETNDGGIAIGVRAAATGLNSIAAGVDAVSSNNHAIAIGDQAQTTSIYDIAIGYSVNVIGNNSIGIGGVWPGETFSINATSSIGIGRNITISNGANKIGIGRNVTLDGTGGNAIAIGINTIATADNTIALGFDAQATLGSAIAIGKTAVCSGGNGIAIGENASSTEFQGVSIGTDTKTKQYGVAIGRTADAELANYGICIGFQSKVTATFGMALGVNSLGSAGHTVAIGDTAHATQESNVSIGRYAGKQITSANIISLHSNSDANGNARGVFIKSDPSNFRCIVGCKQNEAETCLGYNYQMHVVGNLNYTGSLSNTSDERLKKNVHPLTKYSLKDILKLKPVEFKWKKEEEEDKTPQYGFIAQEVEKIMPELVSDDGNYKAMKYVALIPMLVKSIQELNDIVKKQDTTIKKQGATIEELRKKIK